MDLNKIQIFIMVAKTNSFTLAAEDLGMTKSKISRQVKELEQDLEIQLFHRTTRRISLSQAGQKLYSICEPLVSELELSERKVKSFELEPSGILTVTFPSALGMKLFSNITNEFSKKYPKVQLDVILSDNVEDLVGKGIDCAIRGGVLEDSSIICRHLFSCQRGLFASPQYLEDNSTPRQANDLLKLDWVAFKPWRQNKIKLLGPSGVEKLAISKHDMSVNSLLFLQQALKDDVGVGVLPSYLSDQSEAQGELVRVLPDYKLDDLDFYLVYPNALYLSPALQAFKEFCYQTIAQHEFFKKYV